jgi:azurin
LADLYLAANDPSPRVRLEAARVASYFETPYGLEVAYQLVKHPMDYYLDYIFKESTSHLKRKVKDSMPKDPELVAALAHRMSDAELAAAPVSEPVLEARLQRASADVNGRNSSLEELAKLRNSSRAVEAVGILGKLDKSDSSSKAAHELGMLLTSMPGELAKVQQALHRMAGSGKNAAVRRAAAAGLVAASGHYNHTWDSSEASATGKIALAESVPLQMEPASRAAFQKTFESLLQSSETPLRLRNAAVRVAPYLGEENLTRNFSLLVDQAKRREAVPAVASAIRKFPHDKWSREQAATLSDSLLQWCRGIPAAKRTEQEFVETVQVGMDLATLLPEEQSTKVRNELLDLGVSVFVVKTVREQMRYDVQRLVVLAGKPFEIVFENDDMMPHNLVVVAPGSREEIGTAADKMLPTTLDQKGRPYIPRNNNKVLAGTKLINPGEREALKLTAPSTPGNYEYVCTFPEHWKIMFGELVVVNTREELLKASRELAVQKTAQAGHEGHQH